MKYPSIEVPVKDIVDIADKAYSQFFALAEKLWYDRIDAFWEKNKYKRNFWAWGKKWKTKKDVELYFGKPEKKGKFPHYTTFYFKCYHNTYQSSLYENIMALYKNNPDAKITMLITEYNTLMSFKDYENE